MSTLYIITCCILIKVIHIKYYLLLLYYVSVCIACVEFNLKIKSNQISGGQIQIVTASSFRTEVINAMAFNQVNTIFQRYYNNICEENRQNT